VVRLTLVDESSLSKIAHSAGDPGEPPFTTRKRIGATGKSGERRRQIREPARLRAAGVNFRNEIVTGPGGSQILLEDPAGNLVELFQPARR
jgi:hypothetical protein